MRSRVDARERFDGLLDARPFTIDTLTGTADRGAFLDRLDRELARRPRQDSQELAVLFVDVDRLKRINDTHGNDAGDLVLREIVRVLRAEVRPADLVARLGGDEFGVLLSDIDTVDTAVGVAHRVRTALESPMTIDGRQIRPTVSVGVAVAAEHDESAGSLIRRADVAIYRAKERGRDCVEVFDDALRDRVAGRTEEPTALRTGLSTDQFSLVFQPEVDVRSGQIVAAEAFLRWRHPTRGLITASSFIDIAEETGVIHEVTPFVIDQACAWAREFLAASGSFGVLRVNLSATELGREGLVEMISAAIVRHGIGPERLCVEIPESVLARDEACVEDTLGRLHTLGVRLALDDFGIGLSSLSVLPRLHLDAIKIDRTFVARVAHDHDSIAVVRAAVGLGRALDTEVVAEGVESPEQAAALVGLGCLLGQGDHFGPPTSGADFGQQLRRIREPARSA